MIKYFNSLGEKTQCKMTIYPRLKYDANTLEQLQVFEMPKKMKAGWGITHRKKDNTLQILLTDGTHNVYVAHQNFTIFKTIHVCTIIYRRLYTLMVLMQET